MDTWTGSTWADATQPTINAVEQAQSSAALQVPTGPESKSSLTLLALMVVAGWSMALVVLVTGWVLFPAPAASQRFVPLSDVVGAPSEADGEPIGRDAAEHAAEEQPSPE